LSRQKIWKRWDARWTPKPERNPTKCCLTFNPTKGDGMSDFFDDNPFNDANKDDPFASSNPPGSDNPFADSSGPEGLGGNDDLGIPSFGDTSADLPEILVTPPRL
jgi:hypothetical protein